MKVTYNRGIWLNYFSEGKSSSAMCQFLRSALQKPPKVTKITTPMLRHVKKLLNLVDSLTPIESTSVRKSVMAKAHKSG